MNNEKPEFEEEKEAKNNSFIKGTIFGSVLTAVLMLAAILGLRAYSAFSGRRQDASVLTSFRTWQKLREVRELISTEFLYDVDSELLETYLFKGIAAGLDDRYAAYYSASEMDEISREQEGEYYGLGVVLKKDSDQNALVVQSVYEDSPAQTAGIQSGDILEKIEDTDVTDMDLEAAISLIKEYENTGVRLQLRRGEETLQVQVQFDQVALSRVTGKMLDEKTGYIMIPGFEKVTVTQFEETLQDLLAQGMTAMIVDVRDNPGGLLDSVTEILDDLLGEGLLIYTETRSGEGRSFYSDEDCLFDGPVAVLVNGDSASAAEVFAGVLQDYERGPVVGVTTFGKGIVQKTFTLPDGSAFKLTAEKYFTAKGQDVDGVGITPDLMEEDPDRQLERAQEALE